MELIEELILQMEANGYNPALDEDIREILGEDMQVRKHDGTRQEVQPGYMGSQSDGPSQRQQGKVSCSEARGEELSEGLKWKSLWEKQEAKYYQQAKEERKLNQQTPGLSAIFNYGMKRKRRKRNLSSAEALVSEPIEETEAS